MSASQKAKISKKAKDNDRHKTLRAYRDANPESYKDMTTNRKSSNARKVLCVQTKTVYNSVRETARELGIGDRNVVSKICNGVVHSWKGLQFCWFTSEADVETLVAKAIQENKPARKNSKPVLCLTNGVTYQSCAEAARQLGIYSGDDVSRVCNGRQKQAKGNSFEWARVD